MHNPGTILIVTAEPATHETLATVLINDGYRLEYASDDYKGLVRATSLKPALIVLDASTPETHAFELCRQLHTDFSFSSVPVVLILQRDDNDGWTQGFDAGADDIITVPFDPVELRTRIHARLIHQRDAREHHSLFEQSFTSFPYGLLFVSENGTILLANPTTIRVLSGDDETDPVIGVSIFKFLAPEHIDEWRFLLPRLTSCESHGTSIDVSLMKGDGSTFLALATIGHMMWNGRPTAQIVIQDITEQRKTEEARERSYNDLTLAYDATLAGMVRILDLRHKEADGHTYRVTEMAVRLARALGIRGDELVHIRRGALLHDIGKMAIPDNILFKTNALTEDEWALIRKHPEFAYEWLSPITFLRSSLDIPYSHHEKWDGTGYPRRLKAEDIPLAARIFSVVDVWDSLRTPRPYRAAWSDEKVRSHIRLLAGTHFQPDIVEVFLTLPTPDADNETV